MSGFNPNQQRMRMMYQQNPGQQQVRSLFCQNLTDENVFFCNQTKLRSKWTMVHAKDRETKVFTKSRLYIDYNGGKISESFFTLAPISKKSEH